MVMDYINTHNTLSIKRNNELIFEIVLSKNKLIRFLKIKKHMCQHFFDEDYDYDHKDLKDWEIHGKICYDKLNDVITNCDTVYEFYYSDDITVKFIHNDDGFIITYDSCDFGDITSDKCVFTHKEFSNIKNGFKNLISS